MAISDEISRIKTAAESIRSTLVAWGVGVTTDKIGDSATKLSGITAYSNADEKITSDMTTKSVSIPKGYNMKDWKVYVESSQGSVNVDTKGTYVIEDTKNFFTSVTVTVADNMYDMNAFDKTMCTTTSDKLLVNNDAVVWNSSDSAWEEIEGSMENNGAWASTIDGLTTTSVTIPGGYHQGSGSVSLTDDIETALAAI